MKSNYELYFIVNPELSSEKTTAVIQTAEEILSSLLEAQSINTTSEGLKNLAYPINKHWNGYYVNITFDVAEAKRPMIKEVEKKINLQESIVRYIIIDRTEYLVQKAKETLTATEITDHRELNKGRAEKICISKFLGKRVIDYKEVEYLKQFTSPYAKIFSREKTGSSAKFQRKITKAIKQARHMGMMPFTTKHYS
jgi:small subunit ribosomal protein S18